MVRDAGHEIGLHGYSHENPVDMSFEQQKDVLDKTYRMLTDFCGKPPRGSVAPWWEVSKESTQLMLDYGLEYDHSMSHDDAHMYWLRSGDTWTKIDYSKKAAECSESKDYQCKLMQGAEHLKHLYAAFYTKREQDAPETVPEWSLDFENEVSLTVT